MVLPGPASHLMKTGLFEVGGNDCFANLSGRLVVSSWITVKDGVERYADGNGYLCKDVIRENGTILKTAGADGWQVASGWVNVANQRFYAEPGTGVIHRGWLQIDGDWYWLDADSGAMKTGWVFTDGAWYYLNADGKWQLVGNASMEHGITLTPTAACMLAGLKIRVSGIG